MKPVVHALTLHQPWAAAVALGHKKVETRSWRTKATGLLAIHAAKRWQYGQRVQADRLRRVIDKPADWFIDDHPANARGAVVCLARLVRCEEMTQELIQEQTAVERAFGGWEPGRHVWFLEDVIPLERPLPLRGRQGIWLLPDDTAAELLSRAGLA